MERPLGVTIFCILYVLIGIVLGAGAFVQPGFIAPACWFAAAIILVAGAVLMSRSRSLGWKIVPLGLLLPLTSEALAGRYTLVLLIVHLCYFARPSAREHLRRGPDRDEKGHRHSRRLIQWWLIAVSLLLLSVAAVVSFRSYVASRVDEELASIRAAGHPVTLEELDRWYAVAPGVPNAADAYAEAFESIVWEEEWASIASQRLPEHPPTGPLAEELRNELSECVRANERAIELLCRARDAGECRYPVDLTRRMYEQPSVPHLRGFLPAVVALYYAAIQAAEGGDGQKAAELVTASLALGNSLRDEPVVVSQLFRLSALSFAIGALEWVVSRDVLPEEALEPMQRSLEASRCPESLKHAFIGERVNVNSIFYLPDEMEGTLWPAGPPPLEAKLLRASGLMDWDRLASLELLRTYIALGEKPPRERVEGAAEMEPGLQSISRMLVITRMTLPSLNRIFSVEVAKIARLDLALAALAIERFRLKEGELPDSLDALVPHYLPEHPVDPFDGKPIRFVPEGTRYRLYSVGEDKIDGGGQEEAANGDSDIIFAVGLSE